MAVRLRPVGGAGLCRLPETRHGPHCDAGRIAHACETAPTRNHKGADAGGDWRPPLAQPMRSGDDERDRDTGVASYAVAEAIRQADDARKARGPMARLTWRGEWLPTRKCEFGFWRRGLTSHYIRSADLCAVARPSRGCPARRCRDDRPASEAIMLVMAAGYERLAAHAMGLERSGLPHEGGAN
jgi:hypothetical protein